MRLRFKEYLLTEETVKFSKPKEYKSKEISFNGTNEITIATENPNPTSVSGVRRNISRKKFPDEEKAKKAFDKMIVTASKQGWIKK